MSPGWATLKTLCSVLWPHSKRGVGSEESDLDDEGDPLPRLSYEDSSRRWECLPRGEAGEVETMAAFYSRACDCSEHLEENGSGKVALRLTLRALTLSQNVLVQVQTSTRCSLGSRFSTPEVKDASDSLSHAQVCSDSRFTFPLRGVFWPAGDRVTETPHHLQLRRSAEGAPGWRDPLSSGAGGHWTLGSEWNPSPFT